jgi:hypothetical protein
LNIGTYLQGQVGWTRRERGASARRHHCRATTTAFAIAARGGGDEHARDRIVDVAPVVARELPVIDGARDDTEADGASEDERVPERRIMIEQR